MNLKQATAACIVALAITFGTAQGVFASPIQVFNAASLNGPVVIEDFEDAVFVPGVSFSASSRTTSAAASSGVTTSGVFGLLSATFPQPITMTFTSPVYSAGLYFGNDEPSFSFQAFLDLFQGATLIITFAVTANRNDFVDQFIGFNSDVGVTSMSVRYGSPGNQPALFTFIDDVQFNTQPQASVPEPATLALLGTGAAMLAARRRRKGAMR